MVNRYDYFSNKLFFTILFILNFSITISTLSFEFPTAVTLNNGNIFVIHKTGVSVCDPSFETKKENIITFTSGNQISSDNYLSKVSTSKFNEGYIISVIINKIYIFNPEGQLEYTSEALTDKDVNIFISRDELFSGTQYYYLLGYIYQNSIYIKYYFFTPSSKINTLHSYANSKKDYYYNNKYFIKNQGISCQMLFYKQKDLIVCADYVYTTSGGSFLTLSYFNYDRTTQNIDYEYKNDYYEWNEIMCIKSTYGEDRTKALFCLYLTTGKLNCLLYDVNAPTNTLPYKNLNDFSIQKFYALKVYYFPETNQYGLSYINLNGNIQVIIYNSTFQEYYKTIYKFSGCQSIYSHSLVYIKNLTNYYIITDAESACNGNYSSFVKLIDDSVEEEEEEEEKEEEEEDKEEEEEEKEEEDKEEEEEEEEEEEKEEKKEEEEDRGKEEEEEDKEEEEEEKEEEEEEEEKKEEEEEDEEEEKEEEKEEEEKDEEEEEEEEEKKEEEEDRGKEEEEEIKEEKEKEEQYEE